MNDDYTTEQLAAYVHDAAVQMEANLKRGDVLMVSYYLCDFLFAGFRIAQWLDIQRETKA